MPNCGGLASMNSPASWGATRATVEGGRAWANSWSHQPSSEMDNGLGFRVYLALLNVVR